MAELKTGLSVLIFFLLANAGYAQEHVTTLNELVSNAQKYDTRRVLIKGEVLSVMPYNNGTWVNISDGSESLGVWFSGAEKIPEITRTGSYRSTGDIIIAEGIFCKNSASHYGEMMLQADMADILFPGKDRKENVPPAKKRVLINGAVLAAVLMLIYFIKRCLHDRRTEEYSNQSA